MLTPQDLIIADARANGLSQRQIEAVTGINDATVNRRLQKPDVKAQVDRIQARVMAEAAEQSADNIIYAINKYQSKGIKDDPQLREHGYKSSNTMLQAIGILPSHAQSMLYVNIQSTTNVQTTQELSDIGRFLAHKREEVDTIEGEIVADNC